MRIKELPGAPWSTHYILKLLEGDFFGIRREPYDVVIANGYEYTMENEPVVTERALKILHGK